MVVGPKVHERQLLMMNLSGGEQRPVNGFARRRLGPKMGARWSRRRGGADPWHGRQQGAVEMADDGEPSGGARSKGESEPSRGSEMGEGDLCQATHEGTSLAVHMGCRCVVQ
jgi:hypothetical protein